MGVGRLDSLVRGPCLVNMFSLWQISVICMVVFYTDYYFWRGDSASYFIGMIMLISKIGTLTQTRGVIYGHIL